MPQFSPNNAISPPAWVGAQPSKTALRRLLLAQRVSQPAAARALTSAALQAKLLPECLRLTRPTEVVALFSAHLGEPEVLALTLQLQAAGRAVALPVVQGRGEPLRFARWAWGDACGQDAYGISVPVKQDWVHPSLVVLPCVGFTVHQGQFYRLGYGGGFYDRTLARLRSENPALRTLGVAYASSRCAFEPAAHDVALDGVLIAPIAAPLHTNTNTNTNGG